MDGWSQLNVKRAAYHPVSCVARKRSEKNSIYNSLVKPLAFDIEAIGHHLSIQS